MRRFERIYDVVEPVEEYRAGGYHPVHLGDIFHQRYHIIGKWAFGQFSTVWLARDSRSGSCLRSLIDLSGYQAYIFSIL
jgi:serine/threonine-protein kinase SRPK3